MILNASQGMADQETTEVPTELPTEIPVAIEREPDFARAIDAIFEPPIAESTDEPIIAPIETSAQIYDWRWEQQAISIAYEVMGTGSPILLLPALSTISSRDELRELGKLLSTNHQVYILDWVGFGESDRPNIKYEPKVFRGLLRSFVRETFSEPIVVMAAGHTAGYVMDLVAEEPKPWSWVVLLAPTWRGPLQIGRAHV